MIREATMKDVDAILKLVNANAKKGLMLMKSPYAVYVQICNFLVYEEKGKILGCARLAIAWNDLAEVASLAVDSRQRGKGIGRKLVEALEEKAKKLHIKRLFSLSYQVGFFTKCGYREIDRNDLPHKVFGECLNCPKVNCCDEHAFIKDI